ncbi:SDR family NAD(P)-dependent oxidoreductase [Microtetraspora sp. AC03309]|uniref:SDR family NAD(P)-dependent oxidoreductase n=1 Tax=Microtetraspora sp. AC03309 TaxID=2779376 RepID=UPI001E419DE0|nr:SDR family NAD(P)-dependent oxidoreductase [Microtetraspora sp. AC03309]MCC5577642.1 SDR family NAD(P)-dependent oxidoreductase [Microtetraspora sp. AC03309]
MPTIAIVGAGPGLGASLGKVFGGHGFDVALISRSKDRLDVLAAGLADRGITAEGFPADVTDTASLTAALEAAAARFGRIDVLEFSPYAGLVQVNPAEVTLDNLQPAIQEILYGAVTATRAVLPAMLEAGSGTLLYTTGGGAIAPYPFLATLNAAQAALRNWAHNLHNTLADQGIHAATVAVNAMITDNAPEGFPAIAPDDLAQTYWDLHTRRDQAELVL